MKRARSQSPTTTTEDSLIVGKGREASEIHVDDTLRCACCDFTQRFHPAQKTPGWFYTTIHDSDTFLPVVGGDPFYVAMRLHKEGLLKLLKTYGQETGLMSIRQTNHFALVLHLSGQTTTSGTVLPDGHLIVTIPGNYPYTAPKLHLHKWLPAEHKSAMLREIFHILQSWSATRDIVHLLRCFDEEDIAEADASSPTDLPPDPPAVAAGVGSAV